MREVRGLQGRDFVTDRSTGQRGRARDIKAITINKHDQEAREAKAEAETAKGELAALKAKLGLLGLDLDNLPDSLPGAVVPLSSESAGPMVPAPRGSLAGAEPKKPEPKFGPTVTIKK